MNIDTILTIILVTIIVIGVVSFFIWDLSKNKKIAKFFKKIADFIGELFGHSGV